MGDDLILSVSNDLTTQEKTQVRLQNIDNALVNVFNIPVATQNAARAVANKYQIKHGLTASVPIKCKDSDCPYLDRCTIPHNLRIIGGYCVQEAAAMVSRFEAICQELDIKDDDAVDLGMVKDVVNIEMMIMRIDNLFAADADVMVSAWQAVDHFGKEHFADEVHPLVGTMLSLVDRKMKILEKLNSTRKDKADDLKKKKDPTVRSSSLMARAKMLASMAKNTTPVTTTDDSVIQEQVIEYTEVEYTGIIDDVETQNEIVAEKIEDEVIELNNDDEAI